MVCINTCVYSNVNVMKRLKYVVWVFFVGRYIQSLLDILEFKEKNSNNENVISG